MKKSLLCIMAVLGISSAFETASMHNYMNYLAKMSKSYSSLEELEKRLDNYVKIDVWIKEFNSNPEMSAKMGHNMFSDWSDLERASLFGNGVSG